MANNDDQIEPQKVNTLYCARANSLLNARAVSAMIINSAECNDGVLYHQQGIWIGTPWSAPLQNSRSFWNAGLRLHSTKWSADCKLKWSVIWHSKRLHSSTGSVQVDNSTCRSQTMISTDVQVYFLSKRLGFLFLF